MILSHEIRGGYSEWYLRSQEVALPTNTEHLKKYVKALCSLFT